MVKILFLFGVIGALGLEGTLTCGLVYGIFYFITYYMREEPKFLPQMLVNADLKEGSNTSASKEKDKALKPRQINKIKN